MTRLNIVYSNINSMYFNGNTSRFAEIIFRNFKNLAEQPNLNHTLNDINKLLTSPNLFGIFAKIDSHIIAYIIGEFTKLNDGRNVFFISYLYVSPMFRKHGIGNFLISNIIAKSTSKSIDYVMLICDTDNSKVHDMYLKKGFMPDMILRRYARYDVLSLPIHSS